MDYTVRRLAERFTSVNMKTTSKAAEEDGTIAKSKKKKEKMEEEIARML